MCAGADLNRVLLLLLWLLLCRMRRLAGTCSGCIDIESRAMLMRRCRMHCGIMNDAAAAPRLKICIVKMAHDEHCTRPAHVSN